MPKCSKCGTFIYDYQVPICDDCGHKDARLNAARMIQRRIDELDEELSHADEPEHRMELTEQISKLEYERDKAMMGD